MTRTRVGRGPAGKVASALIGKPRLAAISRWMIVPKVIVQALAVGEADWAGARGAGSNPGAPILEGRWRLFRAGCSEIHSRLQAPLLNGARKLPVVTIVLVCIGLGEIADRAVEPLALAEISGDRDAVPGARVGRASVQPRASRRGAIVVGVILSTTPDPLPSHS